MPEQIVPLQFEFVIHKHRDGGSTGREIAAHPVQDREQFQRIRAMDLFVYFQAEQLLTVCIQGLTLAQVRCREKLYDGYLLSSVNAALAMGNILGPAEGILADFVLLHGHFSQGLGHDGVDQCPREWGYTLFHELKSPADNG